MMEAVPRHDAYSVKEYGQTVRVFRLEREGPFYSEIQGKVRVIRLPRKRRIWNVRDARQWARDKHQKVRAGEPEHGTLATIFDAYLEHRSPVKATVQGRKDDKRRAQMWKAFLGPTRDPLSIERGDLDSFIQKRGYRVIDSWGAPTSRSDASGGVGNVPTGGIQTRRRGEIVPGDTGSTAHRLGLSHAEGLSSRGRSVRPRTVHADLQWLVTVLRRKLTDHCTVPNLRDIARDLHQSAEPRRPVATQDRYERLMVHIDSRRRPIELQAQQQDRDSMGHSMGRAVDLRPYGYLRELLVLVSGTGHRLSEVLSLRWADIDFDAKPFGAIRWRAENVGNKARLGRTVPIGPEVRATLDAIQRERPGIGEAWLFHGLRNPKHPTHRSVADKWLRQAERAAKLEPLPGSLWHAYRRKWATEKKHLPLADVAEAGGWKNARTLQTVYQQSDPAGVLRVVLDATELREESNA